MGHISARIGLISTFFLIFCNGLMKELELGERVEVDDGYVGESPYMIEVPSVVLTHSSEETDIMQKIVQGWHETVNAHLKSFQVLDQVYCRDATQHGYVFVQLLFLCTCPLKW